MRALFALLLVTAACQHPSPTPVTPDASNVTTVAPATITPATTSPQCDPACGIGETCKLVDVICKKAPCPPVPQCVSSKPEPVCEGGCPAGTKCTLVQVQCIKAPCPPIPECR